MTLRVWAVQSGSGILPDLRHWHTCLEQPFHAAPQAGRANDRRTKVKDAGTPMQIANAQLSSILCPKGFLNGGFRQRPARATYIPVRDNGRFLASQEASG